MDDIKPKNDKEVSLLPKEESILEWDTDDDDLTEEDIQECMSCFTCVFNTVEIFACVLDVARCFMK